MREQFIKLFSLPKRAIINRNLPKKLFFELGDFTASDKALFTSDVESIYLLGAMNQQKLNIIERKTEDVHYAEVDWIYIKLRSLKQWTKINMLLHKTLANLLFCIIESPDEKFCFTTCHKRLNKHDASKTVLEEINHTDWFKWQQLQNENTFIKTLQFEQQSKKDWYDFYSGLVDTIKRSKSIGLVGYFVSDEQLQQKVDTLLLQIEIANKIIQQLEAKQMQLLDFGEKINMHMQIKQQQQQIEQWKQELEEMN